MKATTELTRRLAIVALRVNHVLKYGDPEHFKAAKELREKARRVLPIYNNLSTEDPLVYEGREVLWNRGSGLHVDKHDPQRSYAILTAFGDFKGGHIRIPHLGLRVRLQPGDCIAFRGRVLPHESEDWNEGQRISIPHFTHSKLWRSMKMEPK